MLRGFHFIDRKIGKAIALPILVRETGLEPAWTYCPLEPESSASANSAIPAYQGENERGLLVEGGGFEPPKSATADLQSAPLGHSGTPP